MTRPLPQGRAEQVGGPLLLRHALAYVAHGWAVFPLAGKTPAIPRAHEAGHPCRGECGQHGHGYHDATRDQAQILAWWGRYPSAGIGLPCAPNGLAVVDVDPRNGGHETLCRLEAEHGPLPGTLMQLTGGDGLHLVYSHPGTDLPGKLGPGIDVKANGYIVAAPSLHPSGTRYRWSGDGRFARPLTDWPAFLHRPGPPRPASPIVSARPFDGLVGLVAFVLEAREGERNSRLFWAGCRALELVRAGKVDGDAVHGALTDAAARIGLSEAEASRTLRSAERAPRRAGAVA
ncbi:bifunctional DNA primase/polymerase [Streptomyces sp. NY05-11A]|uniref:bifunctional DNA primase/polymerase n=1 Tax=Streptomyces soliscabiei TaxID=588897 RepID=UPI0029BBC258|nr:bifunctional DNA primase/polymerase [Streptomyces sp. NY05-11A]MDX2675801.1 bifunctional DNA primase/polymerase [Streptomyces sp. NY05-11A]